MKKITEEELKKIIENHSHWIKEDCEGWEGMKANLSGTNLSGTDLSGADLRMACLRGADLRWADLRGTDLSGADLRRADLRWADLRMACLRGADLSGADLRGADLSGTDLSGINLRGADLSGTDLSGTDLSGTDLRWANLRWADLRGADLRRADLSGAKLRGAKSVPFIPMTCPDTGSFTAYKTAGGKIVKLLIPEDARRSSATGRKCRCDKALVVEIQNIDGSKADVDSVSSDYDEDFVYAVGKMVSVKDFCEERFRECAEGIHFFINRQEAVEYGE